jgi:hypothetical protein
MYNNNTKTNLVSGAIAAAVGAGVVTTFAMAQGQHPAMAIAITLTSVLFAIVCQKFDAI